MDQSDLPGSDTPPPAESPWPARLAGYRDLREEQQWPLCEQLAEELAPAYAKAKVKIDHEDESVQVRGRVGEVPVRIRFNVDMGWVRPELKIANQLGPLDLERDHEQIPNEDDSDDDWDDDELRVFVAKGIFIEGDDEEIDQTLATLGLLPDPLRTDLLPEMERLRLSQLYTISDRLLRVSFERELYEMADPVAEIDAGVQLAARVATALNQGPGSGGGRVVDPASAGSGRAASFGRVECAYCSTLFVLGATSNCPNCGAAHTG